MKSRPERGNPDELLADLQCEDQRARHRRLRIFFGASAGVGKTYSMPAAARSARAGGADIVYFHRAMRINRAGLGPDTERRLDLGAPLSSPRQAASLFLWLLMSMSVLMFPCVLHADDRKSAPPESVATVDDSDAATGMLGTSLFERNCIVCHGMGGSGGRGPSLNRPRLSRAPDNVALRALIKSGIPPEMPEGWVFTDDDLTALVGYVRSLGKIEVEDSHGNAAHGAEIFARSGCANCHIFRGNGFGYGPELTSVGERRSAQYIRQAILQPTGALPADFLMVGAITATKREVKGIRINEDVYTIQIKDASGKFSSFRKVDLRELTKLPGQTPMPAFEGRLGDSELQDLVTFLTSPTQGDP
jgi:cytochrome c oxidase cbb3-type subunit III